MTGQPERPALRVRWLGRLDYADALELQASLVDDRRRGAIEDTLLLLEHPPVITLGRGAHAEHVLLDREELARRGIGLFDAGRGGDATFHGPGQLVGYPIVALRGKHRDAHRYLRNLEQALILVAAEFGIEAGRVAGLTGVWVGEEKLAAIGVRLSTGWIGSHGFALNVGRDLSGFSTIVPCGIAERGVTSLERLTGNPLDLRDVAAPVARHVAETLEMRALPSDDPSEAVAIPADGALSSRHPADHERDRNRRRDSR